MATMMSVVSEHPAPMLRADALGPVLTGLLTKDPVARTSAETARQQLTAVLAGAPPMPLSPTPLPPPPAEPTPAPAPADLPSARVERIDADDLRALASASKSLLSSVARDARDQARYLAGRRRDRMGESGPVPARPAGGPPPAPRRRRWRFKRRWVVVPVLVTLVVVVLVLVGIGFLVAAALGLI
jgi:hypothetical protein